METKKIILNGIERNSYKYTCSCGVEHWHPSEEEPCCIIRAGIERDEGNKLLCLPCYREKIKNALN